MRGAISFAAAQARHDNMLPPDDGPEPSKENVDDAFSKLMQDDALLVDYMDLTGPDTTTVFQLYQQYGLPRRDKSERDDKLIDQYEATFITFIDGYRNWLGDRLTVKAHEVMQDEIQELKDEAAEYAAECASDDYAEFYP